MSLALEQAISGVITLPLSSMVAGLFAVSEFISIVENAAIIGVPIPKQVAEALIVLKRNYKPVDIRTLPDPPEPEPESETP
jgi:phage-related holin